MTTWREMAEVLAIRLEAHAWCENHPAQAPEPGCPFCDDRIAYRAWEAMAKPMRTAPARPAEVLNALTVGREEANHA